VDAGHVYVAASNPTVAAWHLTNPWSGRVKDEVPSSNVSARAVQIHRQVTEANHNVS
jgi:hypothetical protein